MEARVPCGQPVVRVFFRRFGLQEYVQGAVIVQFKVRSVVDGIPVQRIVDQEIIVAVCGDGPEAVFLHRRQRVRLKVEDVAVFAAQSVARVIEARLHVDRHVHRVCAKAADGHQRAVIVFLAETTDGIAQESESAVLYLKAACAFREFRLSYVLRELDGFICVLGASDTSANKFRFSVIEAAKHIADQYQNCFPILIGLGSVVGQIGNLQTSLLQSRRAIYSHFFFPDQAVLEEVNADAVGTNLLSHKEANEEALLQLIGRNDMDGISRWIREFLETFPADPDYQYLVYTALFSLTARLQKFCYEMNLSTESFEPELLTIIQHPDQLQNIHQISEWLTNICRRICDNLQSSVKSYHQMLCDSAISYIKKHYSDKDLNLNQIADQIQITPTYLSSLFKKYKQQNISTYITNIRIEKACVLLKTTSSSLKEISAMVGYSNQYYFSSCFKKIVGVNPSAYR